MLKIPVFITHFIQHRSLDPQTTLKTFLAEHYSGETVYDDDYQQDMELPFKCCNGIHLTISPTVVPDPMAVPLPEPIEISIPFTPIISLLYPKLRVIKIFQPPRPLV